MSLSQGMMTQKPIEQMTDAELSAELERALGDLEGAIAGTEGAVAAEGQATPQASAPVVEPSGDMMLGIPPEMVQQATAKMVAMGLLPVASMEITPELLMAFQVIIDAIDPGLYDLQQPEQLKEFIDGVNSGAIDLAIAVNRARELAGGAGAPVPTGAGVPIGAAAGFVPGGDFGPPRGAAGLNPAAGIPRPV